MFWIFTCPTKGCADNLTPVNMIDVNNPVQCGVCHALADAVPAVTDKPVAKVTKAKK